MRGWEMMLGSFVGASVGLLAAASLLALREAPTIPASRPIAPSVPVVPPPAAHVLAPEVGVPSGPSRRVGGDRALLVVHGEWRNGNQIATVQYRRSCPEGDLLEAEIASIRPVVAAAGLALEVVDANALADVPVDGLGLVLHHNGGWGSSLQAAERALLIRAHEHGVPILYLGDDAPMMIAKDPVVADAAGLLRVSGNGRYPTRVLLEDTEFPYAKEPDLVTLRGGTRVLAATPDGPAAWIAEGSGAPVGVFDLSVRSSDVCPVFDEAGEAAARRLLASMIAQLR